MQRLYYLPCLFLLFLSPCQAAEAFEESHRFSLIGSPEDQLEVVLTDATPDRRIFKGEHNGASELLNNIAHLPVSKDTYIVNLNDFPISLSRSQKKGEEDALKIALGRLERAKVDLSKARIIEYALMKEYNERCIEVREAKEGEKKALEKVKVERRAKEVDPGRSSAYKKALRDLDYAKKRKSIIYNKATSLPAAEASLYRKDKRSR